MESVSSYYKEEPYFSPSDKYLEPQAYLSCEEQQRILDYHCNQNKRGLSYANRSVPLHDLSRLPHTPERHGDFRAAENGGANAEIFYDDGTYCFPSSRVPPGWTCRQPVGTNGICREDVNYYGNRQVSPRRSKERPRKALGHYEDSPSWNGNPQVVDYGSFLVNGAGQNFRHRSDISSEIIEGPSASPVSPAYYYDVYRDGTQIPTTCHSGMWHPWSDISRPLDRSAAMSPASPLASGLSSQSVASTPNSELEPLANWDHPSVGNSDWFQKPYSESRNGKLYSYPPEMCPATPQITTEFDDSSRRNPNWTFHHPSSRSCQNNHHSSPNRGIHPHGANPTFVEMSPDKNTEVNCKYYSSVESISDSYELRNGSWTLHPEKREYDNSNNRYSDDTVDSVKRFDEIRTNHSSSTSDGTSESTLKASPSNCNVVFSERKYLGQPDAPYKKNSEQLQQPKTDSECPTKDAELFYQKQRIKNAKKAEKALCELEEIYNNLNLDDYDLLDRAERRDLPTAHQMLGGDSHKSQPLTRSKSDTFYEIFGRTHGMGYSKSPRAPPFRRAGIPDRIADDMALRKQQKRVTKLGKPVCSPSSFLLCSSHFTPSIPPVVKDFPFVNKPDVEYDDLSYRKFFQPKAYHELPQPPFGIPLHPMVQCPNSNYLHATPSSVPRALCHARLNPDLVRDDMAFRNLRKDNPQRCAPDEIPSPGR